MQFLMHYKIDLKEKIMTTKDVERIAYNYLWKKGTYLVFEVAVPRAIENKYHRQRIDLLSYDTTDTYRCYEIKNSVSDFYSGCKWSFIGHYNYFILNSSIYEKVKKDIPDSIGVWLVYESGRMECVKKPKRQELKCRPEQMMFSMLQGLSREYKKYRKILEKQK